MIETEASVIVESSIETVDMSRINKVERALMLKLLQLNSEGADYLQGSKLTFSKYSNLTTISISGNENILVGTYDGYKFLIVYIGNDGYTYIRDLKVNTLVRVESTILDIVELEKESDAFNDAMKRNRWSVIE